MAERVPWAKVQQETCGQLANVSPADVIARPFLNQLGGFLLFLSWRGIQISPGSLPTQHKTQ